MQFWPHHYSAALIARAKTLMGQLRLKFKSLFQSDKTQFEEILSPLHIDPNLPPLEYKSAESNTKKPKAEKAAAGDPAKPKRKRAPKKAKEPCPHCGRPYGKKPESHAMQCLREKKERERAEREKLKIQRRQLMSLPLEDEKVKKAPKPKDDQVEINELRIEKPKPYNVRCPHCKRLIKQPYEMVGDEAYQAAQQKIGAAINAEMNKPEDEQNFKPLLAERHRNEYWMYHLAIPAMKAHDAKLREKPCFINGQPITLVVTWTPPPPHFVEPHDQDWRGKLEAKDYKLKERRLRAEAKRDANRKGPPRDNGTLKSRPDPDRNRSRRTIWEKGPINRADNGPINRPFYPKKKR